MLEFLCAQGVTLVSVDTPVEEHFTIMPPELDEITNPQLAYLRLHGRDAHAYTTGKTVATRFDYDYSEDEIKEVAARSRKLAEQGATGAHRVQQQHARLCTACGIAAAPGAEADHQGAPAAGGAFLRARRAKRRRPHSRDGCAASCSNFSGNAARELHQKPATIRQPRHGGEAGGA
jgi:hypothetical protein